ncbi:MAG: bifunctional acetate--CoA ligase family protein/GNAT family N-acetyltransferase [Deltaproteobacteria bacterium]|nr:bifunctional acetate--CoA ligase family protein/GNAT family N-acetyltransferase [Deltaproteobacteria bacterium]MBW2321286.1 bifunctional acetate--CoA ligase family protein/GNAT family N-acetyltransferase [Deltaproteobacteria bacterium]
MSAIHLDKIFRPKSIAVVGASQRTGSIGSAIMRNLIQEGYPGKIYPVNPHHKTIWELQAFPSLLEIESPVDLVIMAAPIASALQIVKECKKTGVGGVVIISAGGKETGTKGRELESAIKKEAKDSGLRIIGPNCLGIVCSQAKLNASFASHMPLPGKMAFISQSGAICTSVLDLSIKEQIGFSYVVSLGSMLDVDFGDMIDYLGGDYHVNSIIMYIESLSRFRNFMSAARAVSRVKPIIAVKAGRTQAGAKAAATHTGSLAGEDAVYDAAFERAGIVRVKSFEELFDCAELLAKQPRPLGPGLAIITNAGGPGVMAADALFDCGVDPVALRPETIQKLDEFLPPYWSRTNPIDILGDATPERYQRVVDVCLKASEVKGLLIILTPQAMTRPTHVAETLASHLKGKPYPVFTSWMGGRDVEKGREIFIQEGIPTFDTPERAVRAFLNLYRYSKNIKMLQEIPPNLPKKIEFDHKKARILMDREIKKKNFLLTEIESKDLLSAYGISVNLTKLAASGSQAEEKAREIGLPVAMKICSRDIIHKSNANGVLLNLKNELDVHDAFTKIMTNARSCNAEAKIEGITVQTMLSPEYELILGSKRDRDFGPVVLFGMGGIMAEVLEDQAIALPPLNRLLARSLMEKTRVYRLLKGYRNHPPANLTLLEEILIRLSQLVTDFPEIEELDINPLMVTKNGFCAVDARVLLKSTEVPSPLHLVISPYPSQYEFRITHEAVGELFIRPIKPEDAPLLVQLFESLSPQSILFRFFSPLKMLPHRMLARFTQIDYDREIALVAVCGPELNEKMLGVARVIGNIYNRKHAEFSVIVGDLWQGKGIGAELLKRCLSISKERGIEQVTGIVLPENTQMLALGKKLGFSVKRVVGESDYKLEIDLTRL